MTIIHYTLSVTTKIRPDETALQVQALAAERGLAPLGTRIKRFFAKKPEPRWAWYEKRFESDHEIREGDDVIVDGVKVIVRDRSFHVGTKDRPEGVMKLKCWPYYMGRGLELRFDGEEADEHVRELEEAGFIFTGASR